MQTSDQGHVEDLLATWPLRTQTAAKELIASLGPPTHFVADSLKWIDRGRWKGITLHRDEL